MNDRTLQWPMITAESSSDDKQMQMRVRNDFGKINSIPAPPGDAISMPAELDRVVAVTLGHVGRQEDADAILSQLEEPGPEPEQLFGLLDTDGDGIVTRDEWEMGFRHTWTASPAAALAANLAGAADPEEAVPPKVTQAEPDLPEPAQARLARCTHAFDSTAVMGQGRTWKSEYLAMKVGDTIVLEQSPDDKNWWGGHVRGGSRGHFPKAFVQRMEPAPHPHPHPHPQSGRGTLLEESGGSQEPRRSSSRAHSTRAACSR